MSTEHQRIAEMAAGGIWNTPLATFLKLSHRGKSSCRAPAGNRVGWFEIHNVRTPIRECVARPTSKSCEQS